MAPLLRSRAAAVRPTLFCLAIWAFAVGAYGVHPSSAAERPGLELKAATLQDVVARLREATGKVLQVEDEIKGRRVSVFARPADVEQARSYLAIHLGYKWLQNTKGEDTLSQDETREALPARLRAERLREANASLTRRLRLARSVVNGDPKAVSSLKEVDITNGTLLENPQAREQHRLLSFLGDGDFERLGRSTMWLSRPLGTFPPRAQAAAQRWGHDGVRIAVQEGAEPTEAQIREALAAASRDFGHRRILLKTFGEPDNPGVKGGLVNPLPLTHPDSNGDYRVPSIKVLLFPAVPERVQVSVALPMLDKPGKDSADPALQRLISLTYAPPRGTGLDHPVRFEDVLAVLARVTGMNVMADSYQSSRGDFLSWGKPLVNVPLWRVLRQIQYDFWYDCEVKEGWLLFRHRRWPFEEEKELPASVLSMLEAEVQTKRGFSQTLLQQLARNLTAPQFGNLRAVFPELRDQVLPYHTFRILGSLNRPQQDALHGTGLAYRQLSVGAQADARAILFSARPYLEPDQLGDLRLVGIPSQGDSPPALQLVFGGGDEVHVPLRPVYPVHGRGPHELPSWFRRAWDEVDY